MSAIPSHGAVADRGYGSESPCESNERGDRIDVETELGERAAREDGDEAVHARDLVEEREKQRDGDACSALAGCRDMSCVLTGLQIQHAE